MASEDLIKALASTKTVAELLEDPTLNLDRISLNNALAYLHKKRLIKKANIGTLYVAADTNAREYPDELSIRRRAIMLLDDPGTGVLKTLRGVLGLLNEETHENYKIYDADKYELVEKQDNETWR